MTQTYSVTLEPRTVQGNDVRKLRRSGKVPGVLYGNGIKDLLVQIDYNDFVKLFKQAGRTNVVEVTINGETHPCLIHDIDVHPVKGTASHVDFYVVNLKEKVQVEVPLEFEGEAPAVMQGYLISENLREVEVEALPNKVPEKIVVDISVLVDLSSNIHVKDLPTTADFVILTDVELVVASVVEPEPEEAPTATEAAPIEGAAPATTDPAKPDEKKV